MSEITTNAAQVHETEERNTSGSGTVNKRISISGSTYKKINIIKMLLDEIPQNMVEAELIGLIVDKAVDYYYKSEEIQSKLTNL